MIELMFACARFSSQWTTDRSESGAHHADGASGLTQEINGHGGSI